MLSPQDLKRVLKKAGLEGQEVVFLFNDTQILHEGFLEDLNNILNAGEGLKRPQRMLLFSYRQQLYSRLPDICPQACGVFVPVPVSKRVLSETLCACVCRRGARPTGL